MAEHKELGFDDSPPRNTVILAVGTASVLTLVLLTPLFTGYFDHMVQAEMAAKLEQARGRTNPARANLAAQERQLSSARISVGDAMGQLGRVGRRVGPEPQPSTDVQAVLGWNQLQNQAAADAAKRAMERAAAGREEPEAAAAAAVDGGVPTEAAPEAPAPTEGAAPEAPAPAEGAAPEGQNE